MNQKEIISCVKNDGIGILPTDTLYGIVGSAFSKKAVERIYRAKGRDEHKPFIILISSVKELAQFGIVVDKKIVQQFWPGKVSIILPIEKKFQKKLEYLHRGTNALAFRLAKKKSLTDLLKKTGPLVAPSANPQSLTPASIIKEAKSYFGTTVDFYVAGGTLKSEPSTIIKIDKNSEVTVLRGEI